ncbi:MAG: [FeFe] hydrogenase H-cluster radical SAM maturase HydE [Desulfovibrionaceae bacterium]|nr:[FeFe] hydrogenase H-cluster radical SAM maturase HydE [Desulfovibrionaceae bacterium]
MNSDHEFRDALTRLASGYALDQAELTRLISDAAAPDAAARREHLFGLARETARARFGGRIYVRGLIEISNICRRDCLYCGIRRSNTRAARYRLTLDEILACCGQGHALGFRTFVLQGGEDPWFTDDVLVGLISSIKSAWPDCALTLSIGERAGTSYRRFREAGADRFLLRHETADPDLYARLHPAEQTWAERRRCLRELKEAGFQVGAGFMVGLPWQTAGHLAADLLYLRELRPHMVGIGPFVPHHDTPLAKFPAGSADLTLIMVALTRLMLPRSLLPATTALGTVADDGRERAVLAGANVLMPNLSPPANRKKYMLYDNKVSDGDEAAENVASLARRMKAVGYQVVVDRGDFQP